MASSSEETNMEYAPLEDPNPASSDWRFFSGRYKKVLLAVSGVFALACIAVLLQLGVKDPQAINLQMLPPLPPRQSVEETVAIASDFADVVSVYAFNTLLATKIVVNHKSIHGAMQASQFELLYNDFLSTTGSQAPDGSSSVPKRVKRFSTQAEHNHRFAQFQMNVLSILQQNAEEYARNPSSNRARFGVTVHADWTEEEFVTTRLNLRATNLSVHNLKAAAAKSPNLADAAEDSDFKIGNDTAGKGSCHKMTGGTCYISPCYASRAAQCFEHQCICANGACASKGKCVRPGNCEVATGGSCYFGSCYASRHAKCVAGSCVCATDRCARNGACVLAEDQNGDPPDLDCSHVFRGGVRDQGDCGACWALTTAQQLRYMTYAKYYKDPGVMSAQYLVDCMPEVQKESCSEGVKGCCGGLPYRAEQWLAGSKGLPTQEDYGPLRSDTHPFHKYTCNRKKAKKKKVIPSLSISTFRTEQEVANGFCSKGPVALAISASTKLQHYAGGILNAHACPADDVNHAVLYIGVDTTFDDGKPVHIILNSWGSDWGVGSSRPYTNEDGGGFMLFKFGENVCNIVALPTQPTDVTLNS